MPQEALGSLQLALEAATLTGADLTAAAAAPAAAAQAGVSASQPNGDLRSRPWTRLPYPIAVLSKFADVKALPGLAAKPLFQCIPAPDAQLAPTSQAVLVKFVLRTYPEEVGASGQPWPVSGQH